MQVSFFRPFIFFILVVPFMISCGGPEEAAVEEAAPAGPRSQPGTEMGIYTPEQHELYSGRFRISAGRIHQVGRLSDPPGWDHVDNEAENVYPVEGVVDLDVDEIQNTGTFVARLQVPEGDLVIELDRFHEFSPCQGIVKLTDHRFTGPQPIGIGAPPEHSISWLSHTRIR